MEIELYWHVIYVYFEITFSNHSSFFILRRYGMKGPVYLKNRDGQVLSAGQDGGCEWQSGSVHRYSDRITTTSLIGTTTFTLFSHITVSGPAVVLTGLHC